MASLIKDCRTAVSRLAPGILELLTLFRNVELFQDLRKVNHFQDFQNGSICSFDMDPHWFFFIFFFIKLSALWPASGALASLASSKNFHAERSKIMSGGANFVRH